MVFSSLLFLFLFLPFTLLFHFLAPVTWRNGFLFFVSLVFYSWGEGIFVLLMLFAITYNWIYGHLFLHLKKKKSRRNLLIVSLLVNLIPLIFFKYSSFLAQNINALFSFLHLPVTLASPAQHLPLGISFFTFQALSYVIDIYRQTTAVEKNLLNLGLYISLFPQLIAGPIVRFHDIARQLVERSISVTQVYDGIARFIVGLAKKVLIANSLGRIADEVFLLSPDQLSTPCAWIGIVCYSFQIFFDFSGYSDMAIGLGKIFGFTFPENFNYPYIARSVREFWKRWHISLSTWFLLYLYIPLGGNRKGVRRTHINLLIVFFICGFWHGASWNFILWGMAHGVFLILERGWFRRLLDTMPPFLQHTYLLLFVIHTWVLFRLESWGQISVFYKAMYGFTESSLSILPVIHLINADTLITVVFAIALSTPAARWLSDLTGISSPYPARTKTVFFLTVFVGKGAVLVSLLFACSLYMATDAYNPFIYFRF